MVEMACQKIYIGKLWGENQIISIEKFILQCIGTQKYMA